MHSDIGLFFVILAAAGLVMSVVWGTRNWNGNTTAVSSTGFPLSDPEQELIDKISRLQHECNEMQGVLLEYNTNETNQIYWDLLQEKTQAEVEYQTKYSHSRKVMKFTRV